jgi:hypothetical protein
MKFSTFGIIGCVALFMVLPATGPASAEDKLTASDEWSYDYFGYVTAIDGDTAVIGAHGNDDDGSASGSAYIFQWDNVGGVWLEITKLTASDAAEQDKFGYAVTISGDIVVVGAYEDDDGSVDCGSAYVFYRDQGGSDAWGEVVKLTASDAELEDWFGNAAAIDGDTVVVGARWADGAEADSGAAYIFERNAGGPDNWGEVAILTASDASENGNFGQSVSINGQTVIVGADHDGEGGIDSGAAYVYYRDHGGPDAWGEVTKLMADDAAAEARFGVSAAIDGDLVVVGAFLDDGGAILDSGSAYLFDRNLGGPDTWGQLTKLVPSDAAEEDHAGTSVAIRGGTVVVGSKWHDAVADKAGAAYIFDRNRGGVDVWGEVIKLTASDGDVEDYLGKGIAVDDGRVIIGAYGDDGPMGLNSGSVYVFGTPFFVDGFEDGTTDSWDSVTP